MPGLTKKIMRSTRKYYSTRRGAAAPSAPAKKKKSEKGKRLKNLKVRNLMIL